MSPGKCVWGPPRGPPSITKHRCVMSEVSLWVDDRGLVGTQAPQSRTVTCFSEETRWSRWATYVALGNGREQYTEVTSHHSSLLNVHVSRSMVGTCWCSNFFVHYSNTLTLTLPSVFHYFYLREPSLSILQKNTLLSFFQNSNPRTSTLERYDFYFRSLFHLWFHYL